jgi:hypothetical protein
MEWQNPLLRGVFEQLAQRLTLVHYDGNWRCYGWWPPGSPTRRSPGALG